MGGGLPVTTLTACAVVLTAAFLPWATVTGPLTVTSQSGARADGPLSDELAQALTQTLVGVRTTITVTGWTGYVGAQGVQLPNWLVVVAALFVAGFALMSRAPNTRVPKALPAGCCVYGLAHLVMLASVPLSGKGSLQLGFFASVAAYAALVIALIREPRLNGEDETARSRPLESNGELVA